MPARFRLALAALGCDLALYLIMLSLPYRVLDHGASSRVIGLVPLLYAAPYSLIALNAGRFSDRWPRRAPIRAGLGLALCGGLILGTTGRLMVALSAVPLIGVGLGFFWPSVQAGMSEIEEGANLHGLTRLLNIAWSLGKGLGLLCGGLLLGVIGAKGVSLAAAGVWLACAALLPWMARPGDHTAAIEADPRQAGPALRSAFRKSGWLANGLAYGVAATLNYHLPALLQTQGIGADRFGMFLGLVFFGQTGLFLLAGPVRWWHYRAAPLWGAQALLALAALLTSRVTGMTGLLVLAPLFGIALGFAYQSSLYYSLRSAEGRGRQAGIHEAVLGISSASIPLVGGMAVAGYGLSAPFIVAALTAACGLLASIFWVRIQASRA